MASAGHMIRSESFFANSVKVVKPEMMITFFVYEYSSQVSSYTKKVMEQLHQKIIFYDKNSLGGIATLSNFQECDQ